jgi:hypothetical protein
MEKLTYNDYLADPMAAQARIQRAASRSRAEAVGGYVFVPLARFCARLVAVRGVKLWLDPRVAKIAA